MNADANREGFRILRRDRALFFMELLWRWSFGLGVLALTFFAYAHLRQAVLVSDADATALAGQDPVAVVEAAENLIAEALPLLMRVLVPITSVAAVLWIGTAALGRGIITRSMVRSLASEYGVKIAPDSPRRAAFVVLHFARVLMLLILVIGYLGGSFIVGLMNGQEQDLVVSALVMLLSLTVASVVWSYENWVLSLAPIFVVRDGLSALDSVVAAIAFIGRNSARLRAVAIWNSTVRGLVATAISLVGVSTVALGSALPSWVMTALLTLETLAYLVLSDVFLLTRLGAYTSVAIRELAFFQDFPAQQNPSGTAVL